jgi:hypothetical protein
VGREVFLHNERHLCTAVVYKYLMLRIYLRNATRMERDLLFTCMLGIDEELTSVHQSQN